MGTTGTIMGVSQFLKEQNPAVQIVGLQPEDGASIAGASCATYIFQLLEVPRCWEALASRAQVGACQAGGANRALPVPTPPS